MSVIFTDKNYTKNNPLAAGYFRVGFVTLRIPPEDIVTSRVVNNEKIGTLRGMNEMFQKTGQARWDVTVSWMALLNDANQTVRYQQWEDLCDMVAIFKAAPFVEVESPHLRQMLAAEDPEFSTRRLSMGLRQLRIDNHPDVVDALKVTLTMTYFNCLPYTQDFGYQGDSGQSVSAYQSQKFKDYISQWRQINMERAFRYPGDPMCPLWMAQNPGELALKWRLYLPIQTGQLPSYAGQLNSPATIGGTVIPSTVTTKAAKGKVSLSPTIAQLIQQIAPTYGIDSAIAQALCWVESGGNVNARSPSSSAVGLFQLTNATQKQWGVSNPYDATQNITGAMRFLHDNTKKFKSYELALAAYNVGPGYVQDCLHGTNKCGKNPSLQVTGGIPPAGVPVAGANASAYVSKVIGTATTSFGYQGAMPSTATATTPVASKTPATSSSTSATSSANPTTTTDSDTEKALESLVRSLKSDGWSVDHRADPGGVGILFMYKEKELRVAPRGSSSGGVQPGLWPEGISVLFVNNLVQIPLAGFQYPTYQHVGPCSSLVQVSFGSKGTRDNPQTDEPVHNGLMTLTSMAHMMEQQYHRLRSQFRSVTSVHRMQAVYVENQVLNMLGIFGLMLDQVTTETVPDSSDMAMAQLTACQYENRFEELTPYKVNAIGDAYMSALQQTVLQGNTLNNAAAASSDEKKLLGAALTYRQQMDSADENDLCTRLLNAAEHPTDTSIFSYMNGATTFTVSQTNVSALTTEFMGKASSYPQAATRMTQLKQSGSATYWTIVDYLMFKSCAYDANNSLLSGSGTIDDIVSSIDGSIISHGVKRQALVKDAYSRLFPYFAQNDTALANSLNQIMQSPTLGADITKSVSADDPALSNSDHGAYRDMGLNSQVLNGEDFNPGMYFTNDKTQYMKAVEKSLQDTIDATRKGNAQQNSTTSSTVSLNGTVTLNDQAPAGSIPLATTTSVAQSIPGDMTSIKKMIHVPGYNMAEAFPTFKLFFMEDNNNGVYYAFDNFYSYSSVLDIEMQRPYNKPATLRIKLMNLTHLFDHKLFNGTLGGKWESSLYPYALSTNGSASTGNAGSMKTEYGKTGLGSAGYQVGPDVTGKDNTEGPDGGGMANRRIPLQYLPLQTGTKIQLRIGCANNPDKLIPVFCGQVTDIEGDEILTITAQSYLTELMTQSGDKLNSNSWFQLGSLAENSLGGFVWGMSKGPAYGGVTIFGDSGDVGTVISLMLKNSGAKHFGHWQINTSTNAMLKGFGWKEQTAAAAGSLASILGKNNLAAALQNSRDRSGDNIMVDTVIQYDGTTIDSKNARSYMDTNGSPLRAASYYIDTRTTMTVWELIKDISRRYPEYLLLEKWYGYPYSCDATLVYGHPLDWYMARPVMLGDTEKTRALNQGNDAYKKWWAATGQTQFTGVISNVSFALLPGVKNSLIQQASTSPDGLQAAQEAYLQDVLNGGTGIKLFDYALGGFEQLTQLASGTRREWYAKLQTQVRGVYQNYLKSVLNGNQQSTDFLKPMRRYHFIDHQSIVHNGLKRNEKIYNTVVIGDPDKNSKGYIRNANPNIPANYIRSLDVTDQINDPKRNVIDQCFIGHGDEMITAYAQSFLWEEVGKMYRGELVLRGIPEIEPMDVLLMMDPSTGLIGPIEVETVTHIMNLESGFITIIKPRACVCINEAASANYWRMLMMAMSAGVKEVHRLSNLSLYSWTTAATVGATSAAGATAVGAGLSAVTTEGVTSAIGTATLGLADAMPVTALGTAAADAIGATGVAAVNATAAVAETAAVATAFLCTPLGLTLIGLCAIAAIGGGVWYFMDKTRNLYPLALCPLTQFGRPWTGGIEGWSMEDLVGVINNKTMQFAADEVFPLIDSWLAANGYPTQIPSTAVPSWEMKAPPTI